MKKFITLSLFGALALSATAQTQKGQSITSGLVRGSLSQGKTGQDKTYTYTAEFSVNRGHFFKDNWLIGYSVGLIYNHVGYDNATYNISQFGQIINGSTGLFLRRYWPVLDRLYVYAGGGLTGTLNRSHVELVPANSSSTVLSSWGVGVDGQLGALYTLSNRIAVEAYISNQFPTGLYNANFGVAIRGGGGSQTDPNSVNYEAPQTQKGRWLLGGSANIAGSSSTKGDNTSPRQSAVSVGLSAGRFVKNNLLVGLATTYAASRAGDENSPGPINYSLAVSAFARSYLGTHRLRPFVEGKADYGSSKSSGSLISSPHVGANVTVGLAYMVGDRFIIQTALGTLYGRYNWYANDGGGLVYSNYMIEAQATTLSNISVAYSL